MNVSLHFQLGPDSPDVALAEGLPSPESMAATNETPDAWVYVTNEDALVIAHAALWWSDTPPLDGENIGAIGGFAAMDEASAKILLDHACVRLREAGRRIAVGPLNGNTWRRHRYVISGKTRGPFLLEPRNPPQYPDWWLHAGFTILSHYSSSVISLDGTRVVSPAMRRRLEDSGIVIRKLDPGCYEEELKLIHALSLRSFSSNFLYTPLKEPEFLAAYGKVRSHVESDFVRIAEREGSPCGFIFGIRDIEAESRGEKPAVIVKTLAVDPGSRSAGLGSLLVDEVHAAAFEKSYVESIHALEHESNTSRKITGRYGGRIFRNYALFSKPL
ncbi:MAG TPA: GNAT family N-acetyltransferase [Luteolibacter sp.]|nr:GNAT family N-acetyltransferase [Luteolibacter sp.]